MPTYRDVDSRVTFISDTELAARLFRRGSDVDGDLLRRAERVAQVAVDLCPKRTWDLARSIEVSRPRESSGQFSSGYEVTAGGPRAPYALYVHEGTSPHVMPHRSRAQGPYGDGVALIHWKRSPLPDKIRFFSHGPVSHPGNAKNPFLANALGAAR